MPMTSAARRASRASSSVQQPRAPVRYDCGFCDSARWTPVTSWPASTARAAAVAESTPPDMAARTLSPITLPGYPSPLSAYVGYFGPSEGPEVSHVLLVGGRGQRARRTVVVSAA